MGVEFKSKKELVYERLHQMIIRGDYPPGSRLVIDQLAAELGVSQIPIREAIRQLEADGLITLEPYTGATVTELSADFIFEIFALLESLEIVSSRQACQAMTDQQLENMAQLIQHMNSSVHDPEQWSQENKELHLYICDCAGMILVKSIMQKVLDHWDRLRLHYLKDVFGLHIDVAQKEHWGILEAFRSRHADKVEQLIRVHNQGARMSYILHLRANGHLSADKAGY
jgi:DNA-binding GntR family transcriptional regulator